MTHKKTLLCVYLALIMCVLAVCVVGCSPSGVDDVSSSENSVDAVSAENSQVSSSDDESYQASEVTSDDDSEEDISEDISSDDTPGLSIEGGGFNDDEVDFRDHWYTPLVGASGLKISVKDTVKNFKYLNILYDEYGNPYVVENLYGTEFLTPNDAFCAVTYIRKAFSNRGISYVNDKGETCYAVIEYGSDGHLSFRPFENVKPEAAKATADIKSTYETTQWDVEFDGTVTGLLKAFTGVLPHNIKVNNFYIANGVAHVDLNQVFYDHISSNSRLVDNVVSIILSYYGDKGADRVLITINNDSAIKSEGKMLLKKFGSDDDGKHYAVLSLFDVYAIDTYYYPVSFDGTGEGLIAALVEAMDWNKDIAVNSYKIVNRIVYIDLNEAFGNMVYSGLMAESGVSCVIGSINSYYGDEIDSVVLTIEGKPFVSDYQ